MKNICSETYLSVLFSDYVGGVVGPVPGYEHLVQVKSSRLFKYFVEDQASFGSILLSYKDENKYQLPHRLLYS